MRVHEFVDEGLGDSSHLIVLGNETAAAVDPPRFPTAHWSTETGRQLEPGS